MFWCPATFGLNFLAFSWADCNNWTDPPFGLVGRVLSKLREGKALCSSRF